MKITLSIIFLEEIITLINLLIFFIFLFFYLDNAKFEMVNSKYAMTTICNILMNLIVLETKVESTVTILESWKWVMRISSGPKNPVPQNRR